MLQLNNLAVEVDKKKLVAPLTVEAAAGECIMLLGPNGAGKSTLLRAIAGSAVATKHSIEFLGRSLNQWPAVELARHRGVLGQQVMVTSSIRVDELVSLGLPSRRAGNRDDPLVLKLLVWLDVAYLRSRVFSSLSGGEQQRVQLARVLAQVWECTGPRMLLLDESTSALDPAQQYLVMEKLTLLVRERGFLVIMVCHDLYLAETYATRIWLLERGRLAVDGSPASVLIPEHLAQVYGLDVVRQDHRLVIRGALASALSPP